MGSELLQVGDVPDVHLRREVTGDRFPEPFGGFDASPWQGPAVPERAPATFPQQDTEGVVTDGQDDGEYLVRITGDVNRITFLGFGHAGDDTVTLVIDS
ncbi:hypothetical protein GCM10009742_06550 [Kribbella karoonensis]|uniref:Uncharacterized protein n=1 Tax=Kribbella karoonensis TaxID=324851 RepID=A0ABN2CZP9_9ACTN